MNVTSQDPIPPGLSLADYTAMFALGEAERRVSLLGVADGVASFNAEGTAQGLRIVSVDPLYALRRAEIEARLASPAPLFLDDYDTGVDQGRYVTGSATDLPFPDGSYDLALCAHLLFVDGAGLDLAFHLKALREMLRVAEEVRVFPLQEPDGTESRHLKAVLMALPRMGYRVERVRVDDGSPNGVGEMLQITR